MTTETRGDLESFHRFTANVLRSGIPDLSPEECLEWWRSIQDEWEENVAGILEAVAEMEAGEGQPASEVLADLRRTIESRRK